MTKIAYKRIILFVTSSVISKSAIKEASEGLLHMKLYTFCSSCGHVLGRSGAGTATEMKCPKCGAEIEYAVEDKRVTVTILRPSSKQQTGRLKNYSEKIEQ